MNQRKNFAAPVSLLLLVVALAARSAGAAEPQIPARAQVIHARLASGLKPAVRDWISQEAKKISPSPATAEATAKADIQNRFAGQQLAGADIEALVFVVLMEASQDAEKDLKAIMDETKSINDRKAAQRQAAAATKTNTAALRVNHPGGQRVDAGNATAKDKLDSMGDLNQEQQLRLQMALDRRAKLEEMLFNLMKKAADTQTNIIGNLK